MKVALISGTSISRSALFATWKPQALETPHGATEVRRRGELAVLNRHGFGPPCPPHMINHRANIRALADLGFRDIVALCSVGSLRPELPPGTIVTCVDYVGLQQGPATFFDTELRGGRAGIAGNLVPMLVAQLAPEFDVQLGKIYVQTRGPRFETKAEIKIIREWGDVVGMTAAHEADLCGELGLNYNLLAIVDNYANGLEGTEVDFASFAGLVRANQEKVDQLLTRLLEILR
jgi:5'-methylthioadenosine phosphorylase